MDNDPLAREQEFRRQIEQAALDKRAARLRRARPWLGPVGPIADFLLRRLWLPASLLVLLVFGGFFFVLFGFAIKWTDAYACSLAQVRRSPAVIAQLGEPINTGFSPGALGIRKSFPLPTLPSARRSLGQRGKARCVWVGTTHLLDLRCRWFWTRMDR